MAYRVVDEKTCSEKRKKRKVRTTIIFYNKSKRIKKICLYEYHKRLIGCVIIILWPNNNNIINYYYTARYKYVIIYHRIYI